ncbi:YopX family protein [Sphingobacterium multivorum]|uniref:YopX family protein n=1 Tax=Sphingobacterium multivorum TaxID=28454 RepID=UPI003DA39E01
MNNKKKAPVRQIKFRGLRVDGKGWVYGYVYLMRGKYYILNIQYEQEGSVILDIVIEVIPETVGQFTGLLDKNGKEIFEGDILYHDVQGKRVVYYPFAKDVASFGLHHIEKCFKSTLQDASVLYEIISNIHEEIDINSIEGKETNNV